MKKRADSVSNSPHSSFCGPGIICARCAQASHRAAHASGTSYVAPNFNVRELCAQIFPLHPSFFSGACWACGELEALLPAEDFGVASPSTAAHSFAKAVLNAWLGESKLSTTTVRARSESGRFWVEFKPAGPASIHTEAARSSTIALQRFRQAALTNAPLTVN